MSFFFLVGGRLTQISTMLHPSQYTPLLHKGNKRSFKVIITSDQISGNKQGGYDVDIQ